MPLRREIKVKKAVASPESIPIHLNFSPVLSEIANESNDAAPSPRDSEADEEMVTRRERRRKNIIDELFDTEKTYLHHLAVTHKVSGQDKLP